MEEIFQNIAKTVLFSLVISTVLGFLWHLIDELTSNKISVPIVFLLDVLSVFIYALLFILILYYFSNGEFRWYYFLSLTVGIISYKKVFDKFIGFIAKILLKPLKILIKFMIDICIKIYKFFAYSIEKSMKKRYNIKEDN